MELLKNIIKELKINHWIKNLVVFVPLIFSGNLFDTELILKEFIAFISFSLISSSIYIFNDIIDIEIDKKNIEKSKRPVASGIISIKLAIVLIIVLFLISCLSALKLGIKSFYPVILYFLINVLYSLRLKNIPVLDAVCIAFGFILRILSGCFAIVVLPSPLVILLTFFLSLFFTFSKRKMELELQENTNNLRLVLKSYNLDILNQFIAINAVLAISFYITYVMEERTIIRTNAPFLYLTSIPLVLIIYRILYIINTEKNYYDPMKFFEKDIFIQIFFVLYFFTLYIALMIH